ncbi:hypothetical protein GCL60_16080 [Silvanigrella paludirubra]|uniref:ABC transporter permease n=1 Tax=Silvanigrella paludirubra TaxID=2499159 RepID=A0A6N6VQH2_9BACT|nr:ABC-2 family transporter protein [Silvanigrella paludirubra]KAB8036080.1 hypothetical protein GCL60_16080 [Silvanigrella paludirubra]
MLSYIFFIKNSFINFYRNKWSFLGIITFLVIMYSIEGFFWYGFYNNSINKLYSKNSIILYIMIALTMHQIVSCVGKPDQLSEDIETGSIDYFILKPLNYINILVSIHIGYVIARFLALSPIILFILCLNSITHIFIKVTLLFIFSVLCGILNCVINIFLSSFTFFYKDSYGFVALKETLFWILSGSLIPLDILPSYIQNINKYLPFGYIIFYPIQYILNNNENISFLLSMILIWILFFHFLISKIWRIGIKKYLAYGG